MDEYTKSLILEKKQLEARLSVIRPLLAEREHELTPRPCYELHGILTEKPGTIRLQEVLCNLHEKETHIETFGSITGNWDKSRQSVRYYRKYGILLHGGGGWHLLKDEQPCSDEEWTSILAGNIPEKFKP